MSNVIEFGKKPKKVEPSAPVQGDMTGYATARAISKHFGIAISNEDAIKLDHAIQGLMHHAVERARLDEREACVAVCERHAKVYSELPKTLVTDTSWAACIDIRDSIKRRGEA